MSTYTLQIVVEGKDNASGPLSGIAGALNGIGTIAGGILTAGVIQNLAGGIMDFGMKAIGATAQMQAFQVGLSSLVARELRSSDSTLSLTDALNQAAPAVSVLSDKLKKIAILSPYELGQVQDTFRLGMAFGYTTTEAMSFTKGVLNMAAGVGASNDMMHRMAYNFAQIRMQGRVTMMDVRQLAMAGFDLNGALRGIGEQMGVTINDYKDFNEAVADGKIKWSDFATAFEKYADEQFGGASERMSRTLMGLKSTFNDLFLLTAPKVLGPAAEVVTGYLNDALNMFIAWSENGSLEEMGKNLAKAIDRPLRAVKKFFTGDYGRNRSFNGDTLTAALSEAFNVSPEVVKNVEKNIKQVFGAAVGLAGAGGTGLFAGVTGLGLAKPLISMVTSAGPALVKGIGSAFGGIMSMGTTVMSNMGDGMLMGLATVSQKLGPGIGGMLEGAFSGMGGLLGSAGGLLGSAGGGIASALTGAVGGLGSFLTFLTPLAPLVATVGTGLLIGVAALTAFGVAMEVVNGDGHLLTTVMGGISTASGLLWEFWQQQGPALAEIGSQVFSALSDAGKTLADQVIPWITERLKAFAQWFVDNGPLITQFVQVLADYFTNVLLPAIVGFWSVIEPILTALTNALGGLAVLVMQMAVGDWAGAWETMKGIAAGIWVGIEEAWTAFVAWVTGWFGTDWATVYSQWAEAWALFKNIVSVKWEEIKTNFALKWAEFKLMVATLFSDIADLLAAWGRAWDSLMQAAAAKWAEIKTVIETKMTEITKAIEAKLAEILLSIIAPLVSIVLKFSETWEAIKASALAILAQIVDLIKQKVQEFADAVKTGVGAMVAAGADLMQGLYNGIKSKADSITAYLTKIGSSVQKAFAASLKIQSPSRVFYGFGENIMQGLANGLADSNVAVNAITDQAKALQAPFAYSGAGGASYHTSTVNIQVDGSGDPAAVARQIMRLLKAQGVGV